MTPPPSVRRKPPCIISAGGMPGDATAYMLAAAVPIFLWDVDHNSHEGLSRLAMLLILVCGVLSGISKQRGGSTS